MKTCKVLIDGYNLRLNKGSGIKYYTISLIKALEKYIDIGILFDYRINGREKQLVQTKFIEKYLKGELDNSKADLMIDFIKLLLRKYKYFDTKDKKNIFQYDKENSYLYQKNIVNIAGIYSFAEIMSRKNSYLNLKLDEKYDIFHSTYMLNINIKNSKRITTVHDLIPLRMPHTTLDDKKVFFDKVKYALKHSDKIITISEYSKKDILETYDIEESKVVNCYQPYYFEESLNDIKLNVKKFNLEKNNYFLFVGNIEPKKNVGRLIKAFLNIDTDKKLVIVGKKAWLWEDLLKGAEKAIQKKRIVLLDYVSREDLIALYQNAFAFVFPSLYEGFGLPPLEAMACRAPVITSNITSLPEVCGDAAVYCDPYSVFSIQTALEKMLCFSDNERNILISKGLERVKFFNEDDYSKKILKVYESVL